MKTKKKCKILAYEFVMLIVLVSLAMMISIINRDMKNLTKSEYYKVDAKVVKAEYVPSKSYYHTEFSNGMPVQILKHDPDKYNVVISYNGITEEYDTVSMYNKCKDNDTIPIQICILTTGDRVETKITGIY